MPDPLIHVPEPKGRAAGFWVRDRATGAMHFCDAHIEEGSVLYTAWPKVPKHVAYWWERGVDRALDAAGGTLGQAERFFDGWTPSTFWETLFGQRYAMGPGTADFSVYFGHDRTVGMDAHSGLVLDDSDDGTTVTGFSGGDANTDVNQRAGLGPGAAMCTGSSAGHGTWGDIVSQRQGSPTRGVYYGETPVGSSESNQKMLDAMGRAVAPEVALQALRTGTWNGWTLGMGGGGPAGSNNNGRDGGDGVVRVSIADITETTNRDLRAEVGALFGLGSGGGYYAISRRGFTLNAGTTIQLGSNSTNNNARYSGWGRMTLFTVDDPTISGTVQEGIITEFQVYPSVPIGGLLVSG